MEVEFPSSDDDSIYYSDNDVVLQRPPLSPDAIVLGGLHAKELDEAMDIIEAEEMSSEEEDMSEASTQPLTDSLDPISDDDMIDVSSKPHFTDDVMDDSQSPKPDPTNVAVHTSLITPSSSDDPPTEPTFATNKASSQRDESDEDNMVSVPGMRQSMDTAMDDTQDTDDLLVFPQTPPKTLDASERPVQVNLNSTSEMDDDSIVAKSVVQSNIAQPATEVTDLKSTDQATTEMRDVEPSLTNDSTEALFFAEKADIVSDDMHGNARTEDSQSARKTAATSVVLFDADESSEATKNSSSPTRDEGPKPSSFAAKLAAFGNSIVKKSVDQKTAVVEQGTVEPIENPEAKSEGPFGKEAEVDKSTEVASVKPRAVEDYLDDPDQDISHPSQPSMESEEKHGTENPVSSKELPNKDVIDKLVSNPNPEMYADKPSSPSSDDFDDMFYDAQSVPEPSKGERSPLSKSVIQEEVVDSPRDPLERESTSKEDPKSPEVSNDEARHIELSSASLDVPDVEDVMESKKRTLPEKQSVKQQMNENDLEDLDVGEFSRRKSVQAGDSSSPVPDFPAMDEIDINRSVEKSGDQFIPHQPKQRSETLNLEMDEDGRMFGADEFVEEKAVDMGSVPESVKSGATIANTELTTPIKSSKSRKKPASSKSVGSGGFGLFSMSSFYRAFKKPSKRKEGESEAGTSSERDLDVSRSSETDGSSEKKKKRSKKEIAREKERIQSTTSESVRSSVAAIPEGDAYLQWRTPDELAEEERHLRLEETLKSQIATLRSARSGFVDLALLTPMTEKTLAAVDLEAKRILSQLPEIERRKEVLGRQVEILELTTEAELNAKEKTLVAAKIKVAEAKCELDKLRHELFVIKRDIAEPGKAAAQERLRLSMRREKAEKDLRAATESKETMERNLEQRKAMLKTYRNEVSRLEKSVRDVEGDWA